MSGKKTRILTILVIMMMVFALMPAQTAWANVKNGDICPSCNQPSLIVEEMSVDGKHNIYCETCDYGRQYMDDGIPLYTVSEPHWGGEATCKQGAVCEGCKDEYTGIDPSNHAGNSTVTGEKKATCTEAGYTGDTTCDCCGAEIEGEEIAALGHSWGAWTVTKAATTSEEGVETRVCSNDSSHTETRAIPKKEETKKEETKKEETKEETKTETVSKTTDTQPQTGDESQTTWVVIMMLSVVLMIALIRKRTYIKG